jgi:hypothetical protein
MLTSFIAEPESPVFVEENCIKELVWKLVDCHDWQVRIVTDSFQLHPIPLISIPVPIKINTDYNVTETCKDDRKIVHLSIVFNENVLNKSIEYVVCKIFRSNDVSPIPIESRVNFINNMSFSAESTSDAETTTTTEPRNSSCTGATIATMTGSAYNLSIYFMTMTLGLIVASFFSSLWNQ